MDERAALRLAAGWAESFRIPDVEAAIATMSTEVHLCGDGMTP